MSTLLKIEFNVPESNADEAGVFIASRAPHGWEETPQGDQRHFTLYLEDHPLGMEMVREFENQFPDGKVAYGEQESEDWTMAWKDFFNPVNCGEIFTIVPPWLQDQCAEGHTCITIEPKMAFGTGHHPTTSLCLQVIGELAQKRSIQGGHTFFDLGTGSGILAIGLCKLGLTGLAMDIDPQAVVCARENVKANGAAGSVELAVGTVDSLDNDASFDFVVANILSGPLIEMAHLLVPRVCPGGTLVLSGILADRQADAVAGTYVRQGLDEPERRVDGEWAALIWENVGA
ncbi:50S ribosomal protein L11 methyltransferase [Pseudodesulfovibrio sp.]|uniref:50S ribosomal protein L11 methyltransferase n=1 Tax=unclassified Pseudodesulfovibrio TaxID=2661612 RepID=UPI003B00A76E